MVRGIDAYTPSRVATLSNKKYCSWGHGFASAIWVLFRVFDKFYNFVRKERDRRARGRGGERE